MNHADRISELARRARSIGTWVSADDALARRVEDAVSHLPVVPERAEFVSLRPADGEERLGVRSCSAVSDGASRSMYGSFEAGEIACVAEAGLVLGEWIVRGTVWLRDEVEAGRIEWVTQDHVIASCEIRDGEPFRLEEVSASPWHLELTCGARTYRLEDLGR
ncbi:MAG: hypothetical protein R3E97_03465 [Candidatus Eisenbacteria bacterium]